MEAFSSNEPTHNAVPDVGTPLHLQASVQIVCNKGRIDDDVMHSWRYMVTPGTVHWSN